MHAFQIVGVSVGILILIGAVVWLIFQKGRGRRLRNRLLPLSTTDRLRLSAGWMQCQTAFVDDPAGAVDAADRLISDVLRARGRTVVTAEARLSDISAAYPRHLSDYQAAEEIAVRHRRAQASTEDLRKAFVHYRALFEEILGGRDEERKRAA